MLFESYPDYRPSDFIFKIATEPAELQGYWDLRAEVFCEEQGVFKGDNDRDAVDDSNDAHVHHIICATLVAGMVDEVVGTVRIDEREPRLWYGSRLCVKRSFRRLTELSPSASLRNHQPVYKGFGALGASLIYKAVSTANAIGCDKFLANVQAQNAKFFQRLHWAEQSRFDLHCRPHVHMEADLAHYPAAELVG